MLLLFVLVSTRNPLHGEHLGHKMSWWWPRPDCFLVIIDSMDIIIICFVWTRNPLCGEHLGHKMKRNLNGGRDNLTQLFLSNFYFQIKNFLHIHKLSFHSNFYFQFKTVNDTHNMEYHFLHFYIVLNCGDRLSRKCYKQR